MKNTDTKRHVFQPSDIRIGPGGKRYQYSEKPGISKRLLHSIGFIVFMMSLLVAVCVLILIVLQ